MMAGTTKEVEEERNAVSISHTRKSAVGEPPLPFVAASNAACQKHRLTENLWRRTGPNSHKTLRIGLDAEVDDVEHAIQNHIERVVIEYSIPEFPERRFECLSAGDTDVRQRHLNLVRRMQKAFAAEGARQQFKIVLMHLRGSKGRHTYRLVHVLESGKHKLEISVENVTAGVKLEEPFAVSAKASVSGFSDFGHGWAWRLIGGAVILNLMVR